MKKFRFRKFPVYHDAITFRVAVKKLIKKYFPHNEMYLLSDQIIRASNSVILNIAEGSDRSTDKDFANFLNKSNASLNEVVSCLEIAFIDKYITKDIFIKFLKQAEALSNQLTAFRFKLLKSPKIVNYQLSNVKTIT